MLRVLSTTYGAGMMENAEIPHTSISRSMHAGTDTVQDTANALRDSNGAYRSSKWCALQGWKSETTRTMVHFPAESAGIRRKLADDGG